MPIYRRANHEYQPILTGSSITTVIVHAWSSSKRRNKAVEVFDGVGLFPRPQELGIPVVKLEIGWYTLWWTNIDPGKPAAEVSQT